MLINVVARDRGWLFRDLQLHAVRVGGAAIGLDVMASEFAVERAAAWIYIRTAEAVESPDLSRTVVQIHDLFGGYEAALPRGVAVRGAGALTFTHPQQRRPLRRLPIFQDTRERRLITRPIGALERLRPSPVRSPRPFTVGWFGRPFIKDGLELKRADLFVETIRALGHPCRVRLAGASLEPMHREIERSGFECSIVGRSDGKPWEDIAQDAYNSIDALVATSESPAIPLSVFEAWACGVPVVSTPRGWPGIPELALNNGEAAADLACELDWMRSGSKLERDAANSAAAVLDARGWTLESWWRENLELAAELAR